MSSQKKYDVIFFDWVGTLSVKSMKETIPKQEKIKANLERIFTKLQNEEAHPSLKFDAFLAQYTNSLEQLTKTKGEGCFNTREVFTHVFDDLKLNLSSDLKESLIVEFYALKGPNLYPGAVDLLDKISKAGIKLGLIRNSTCPVEIMVERLRAAKVDKYFDIVVMAGDTGFKKPSTQLFMKAVNDAGVTEIHNKAPKRIMYIGNEAEIDVVGANAMGWTSVLVQHTGETSDKADFQIQKLIDLEKIIL